jgi:two-component system response regulator HupR/HoxA
MNEKPALLLVDDEIAALQTLQRPLLGRYDVHLAHSGEEALQLLRQNHIDAVVTGQTLPSMTALELLEATREEHPNLVRIAVTGSTDVDDLTAALNTGTLHAYITTPWKPEALRLMMRATLTTSKFLRERDRLNGALKPLNRGLALEDTFLGRDVDRHHPTRDIVYGSTEMDNILRRLRSVTGTETTVLIQGETGTGKEVIARFIHSHSPRRHRVFLPVNCGAIPRDLVETELFGHTKGAFTGATQEHKGYFQMAQGGTIFLDEIGEAPPELQVKLLRVIQEGEITPVGVSQPRTVDVRIIASTNRDLKAEMEAGRFRQDLYFRIDVFSITLPPLRERPDDILPLAEHLLALSSSRLRRTVGALREDTRQLLRSYAWPGNVRELQNEIERVVLLAEADEEIAPELLSDHIRRRETCAPRTHGQLKKAIRELEDMMIREAMERFNYNKSMTARNLGISRQSLLDKLRRLPLITQ